MLSPAVLRSPDWAAKLADEWRSLAQADESATPFQSWEWQSTWFEHFAKGKKPLVWTLREGNDLVGLMPFVEVGSPWRALRPMGVGPSDYLQPLAMPGREEAVAAELAGFLREESKKRLVDLHQLRETRPLAGALMDASAAPSNEANTNSDAPASADGAAEASRRRVALAQAACLVLDLPDSYDAYLQTLGKSLRYDVKRLDKSPFTDGKAQITPVDETGAREGVDFFFEAHKKRWSKRGLPGAFLGGRIRDFHQKWAALAAKNGWLWMALLELEGLKIGAIYAMRFGKTCFFYQSGFDPSKSSISPGSLLVAHTIKRAIDEGLDRFDFLRGDEPYKRRWKPQHTYKNLRILMGDERAMVKLGMNWNRAAFKWEARIRARFEGKGLKG